jgi:hypothetical protein
LSRLALLALALLLSGLALLPGLARLTLLALLALAFLLAFLVRIVRVKSLCDHERAVPSCVHGARVGHGVPLWNRERGQQCAGEEHVAVPLHDFDGIGERRRQDFLPD